MFVVNMIKLEPCWRASFWLDATPLLQLYVGPVLPATMHGIFFLRIIDLQYDLIIALYYIFIIDMYLPIAHCDNSHTTVMLTDEF